VYSEFLRIRLLVLQVILGIAWMHVVIRLILLECVINVNRVTYGMEIDVLSHVKLAIM
jgi:hypothetical protein